MTTGKFLSDSNIISFAKVACSSEAYKPIYTLYFFVSVLFSRLSSFIDSFFKVDFCGYEIFVEYLLVGFIGLRLT